MLLLELIEVKKINTGSKSAARIIILTSFGYYYTHVTLFKIEQYRALSDRTIYIAVVKINLLCYLELSEIKLEIGGYVDLNVYFYCACAPSVEFKRSEKMIF